MLILYPLGNGMKYLLILLTFSTLLSVKAQEESRLWYFGENAGLDFRSGTPVALDDGALNTFEGCATISDPSGNLLFYTNGVEVYNARHEMMPNGNSLFGDPSSTQSAVIVPHPGRDSLYYVFTTDPAFPRGTGITYSIVNMNENEGLGDVISKNNDLLRVTVEKVAATPMADEVGFWIIGYQSSFQNGRVRGYHAFGFTAEGLNDSVPVISEVGANMNHRGTLKISPFGNWLAAANQGRPDEVLELLPFDNSTGKVGTPVFNLTNVLDGGDGPYGVEFSATEQYLYVTERTDHTRSPTYNRVYQFDISSADQSTIQGSMYMLDSIVNYNVGAVQMGPDGKIYMALQGSDSLGVIQFPDQQGAACGYLKNGVFLGGRKSLQGLPSFEASIASPTKMKVPNICLGDAAAFDYNTSISGVDSIGWNFGDGSNETIIPFGAEVSHVYNAAGQYLVTADFYFSGSRQTIQDALTVYTPAELNLGEDLQLFYGDTTYLVIDGSRFNQVIWSDGSGGDSLKVSDPGQVQLQVIDQNGCVNSDTLLVNYDQLINVELPEDITICEGEFVQLSLEQEGLSYLWSTGDTTSAVTVGEEQVVSVRITNAYNNRVVYDSVAIKVKQFNELTVEDVVLCGSGVAVLNASGARTNEQYRWYDSSRRLLNTTNTGIFRTDTLRAGRFFQVSIYDGQCESPTSLIQVDLEPVDALAGAANQTVKIGETVELWASGGEQYLWEPATYLNDSSLRRPLSQPLEDITYLVTVSNEFACTDTASVHLKVEGDFLVYPNPTRREDSFVTIELPQSLTGTVQVHDFRGGLIATYVVNDLRVFELNIDLVPGPYSVTIINERGTRLRQVMMVGTRR